MPESDLVLEFKLGYGFHFKPKEILNNSVYKAVVPKRFYYDVCPSNLVAFKICTFYIIAIFAIQDSKHTILITIAV